MKLPTGQLHETRLIENPAEKVVQGDLGITLALVKTIVRNLYMVKCYGLLLAISVAKLHIDSHYPSEHQSTEVLQALDTNAWFDEIGIG